MRFTPGASIRYSRLAWAVVLCVGMGAAPPEPATRPRPIAVQLEQLHKLHVTTSGRVIEESVRTIQGGGCPQEVSSHTDASFEGGAFTVQAGFAENEIAAASYVLDPSDFPLRVDLMEMIFATSGANMQTTTHWSVLVWEGTPDTGNMVALFSSDGVILPHIVLPPGTNGVNVVVGVDPGDPDQIIVTDNGSHTFSIGYRIDQHNSQTQDPCSTAPPTCCNAFPTTDVSGLQSPAGNWLNAVNCGPLGCPANGGWASFSQLPLPPFGCRPSGDWVMRATWTPFGCEGAPGACCLPDGGCLNVTAIGCADLQGEFEGEGTNCGIVECPVPDEACCFEGAGCLDLPPKSCELADGFPQGVGTLCAETDCFATGACCMPDGSCVGEQDEADCQTVGGLYQGHDSICDDVECPAPSGGCCFANDFCLELTEADCMLAGAEWAGMLTDCTDADENDIADVCENDCPEDLDGDGFVNATDLAALLGAWGDCVGCPADLNGDGLVNATDLAALLGAWGACP